MHNKLRLNKGALYEKTRQAWRDIWTQADFDRELQSLDSRRAQEVINAYEPFLDRDHLNLEAGCGPGHVVFYFQQRGYPLIGLDYAPEALIIPLQLHPGLRLHVGDVHSLPYPSNYFGSYLSFGVLEHFEHGPDTALAEAFRVLRPGGALILTIPHPNFVENLRTIANRLLPSRLAKQGPRANYYERTYTHQELARHVQNAGFVLNLMRPVGHSYTFYGLSAVFRSAGYYQTSSLGEFAARVGRRISPWGTAFATLVCARKP